MTRRERHLEGYVLLMTLVLLALAGAAMATVSRHSAARAVQALEAQRQLQLRWGVRSCRKFVLPQAEGLLERAESTQRQPVVHAHTTLELGGQRFDLIVTDEQAKLNVNILLARDERTSLGDAPRHLRDLLLRLGSGGGNATVRLRPVLVNTPDRPGMNDTGAKLVSYGQVFEIPSPESLLNLSRPEDGVSHAVTCWGDGRINLRRCSLDAAAILCEGVLDRAQIHRLVEKVHELIAEEQQEQAGEENGERRGDSAARGAVRSRPANSVTPSDRLLDRALQSLELDRATLRKAHSLLTTESSTHGLWIVATDERVKRHYLFVETSSTPPTAGSPPTPGSSPGSPAPGSSPGSTPTPGNPGSVVAGSIPGSRLTSESTRHPSTLSGSAQGSAAKKLYRFEW